MIEIQAVVVNRESARYTELLLKSLYHYNDDIIDRLRVTVINCPSTEDMVHLEQYCASKNIPIESFSDRYFAAGNSHGEILRDFVLSQADAGYFLFLDSDVAFLEHKTVSAMEGQLLATKDAFGIQALLSHDGGNEQPVGSDYRSCEPVFFNSITGPDAKSVATGTPATSQPMFYRMVARLHPCCSLVRNSEAFRLVAEHIGFSCANTIEVAGGKGFDTFSLATQVMKTHGLRHIYSSKMVLHFGGICRGLDNDSKQELRDRLLAELDGMNEA